MLDFSRPSTAPSRPHFVSRLACFLGILLALIATPHLHAQTAVPGGWSKLSPTASPAGRDNACMAYDAANNTIVMFGGYTQSAGAIAETWIYNGTTWTKSSATGPGVRYGCAMAYLPSNNTIVMFGGVDNSSNHYSDTWVWNGSSWASSAASAPSARSSPSMTYDAAIGAAVMFGGQDNNFSPLSDTWTWNGSSWAASPATGPSARLGASMAYDPDTSKVVLFGGFDDNNTVYSDTWQFNGTTWTSSPATGPVARYGAPMAYDPALSSLVLFGGQASDLATDFADTWTWNGTAWISQAATGPTASVGSMMAYYPPGQYLLQFGGFTQDGADLGDTWEFIGSFIAASTPVASTTTNTPVIFNITGSGTLGTITNANVLTQGVASSDFTLSSTSGCGPTVSSGQTCTVNVNFKPTAPGLRSGAVLLKNSAGATIATAYVSGTGTGPLFVYGNGSLSNTYSATFNAPRSPAVDGSGNLFVANSGNTSTQQLYKFASGSTTATAIPLTTTTGVTGLAFDGAGNLFIGLPANGPTNIYELVAGAGSQVAVAAIPDAVDNSMVIDGSGNIYVSGAVTGAIYKIASGTHNVSTVVAGGSGARFSGMTMDAKGNLFVVDKNHNTLQELVAGSTTLTTLYSGGSLSQPDAVAIDAAGNIYVSNYQQSVTYRFAAGSYSTTPTTLAVTAGESLTLTPTGTMVTSVGNNLYSWNRSTAPALSFPITAVSSQSAVQYVGFENDGNAALSFPVPATGYNPSLSANFTLSNSSNCPLVQSGTGTAKTLASGATCTEVLYYSPTIAGATTGNLVFTDNNLTATTTKQTMTLTGTTSAALTIQVIGQNIPSGTSSITLEFIIGYGGNGAPTSTPTLTVNGSTTGVGAISCIIKSGHNNCTATYNPSSLSAGAYPIVATSPAGGAYSTPTTATAYLTILGNSSHITKPVLQIETIQPAATTATPVAPQRVQTQQGTAPLPATPYTLIAPPSFTPATPSDQPTDPDTTTKKQTIN